MTLSEELQWRGFVNQTTLKSVTELDEKQFTFYFGVDPSAHSMQIGNLAAAMMVRHFIAHGHKAILLVGGATGMIGDPDGKSEERELKPLDEIAANKEGIATEYTRVFDGMDFTIVDNYDWFKNINYLDFLRTVGKHFSMTQLLDRDFVKSRIGEGGAGISYAEFSYALIQGYDFLHLYREYGVNLQICGSDQWGNSIVGAQMIRKLEGGEAHVYSTPLVINKTTGKKFGKSEGGAIWLNENETSVYKFYQFWLNADDEGVFDYIKIYTLLSKDEVEELQQRAQANPGAREAQKVLAFEVTKLVHGEARAKSVERVTNVLFGDENIQALSQDEQELLANEIPTGTLGQDIVTLLVETGLAKSKGEARRLIANQAVSVNGEKIAESKTLHEISLVKKGKNSFILVH